MFHFNTIGKGYWAVVQATTREPPSRRKYGPGQTKISPVPSPIYRLQFRETIFHCRSANQEQLQVCPVVFNARSLGNTSQPRTEVRRTYTSTPIQTNSIAQSKLSITTVDLYLHSFQTSAQIFTSLRQVPIKYIR